MIPNSQRININNSKSIDKSNNKQIPITIKNDTSPRHSIQSFISSPPNTPRLIKPNQKPNSKQAQQSQINLNQGLQYRRLMNERLQKEILKINSHLDQKQAMQKVANINKLINIKEDQQYLNTFFFLYDQCLSENNKGSNDQLVINLKTLSKKKIVLTSEKELSVKRKKSQMIEAQNDNLKKELFKSRQTVKTLQKRLLRVLEEFKARKAIYISQIDKLTNLINSTIIQIPLLVMNNPNRRTPQVTNRQRSIADMQQHHKKHNNQDYNSIHIRNDSIDNNLMFGLSGVYKAYEQIVDYEPKHFSDPKKMYKSSSQYFQDQK